MTSFDAASHIVHKLRQAGHTAYFAGGWVRDYLLQHPSDDIDIATEAPPEEVQRLFPHTVAVGAAFGVVIVIIDDKPYEVSSFRKDGLYLYGRRPESIEFATPEEDAQRRDFTINGMFFDPVSNTILDYVEGQKDLQKGIVKAIGEPMERFREDRLRMIRAVRMMARFNFQLDPPTREAIANHALTLFPAVAVERIWQEFNKMAAFPGIDKALVEMHALGLLQQIFPSLESVDTTEIRARVQALPDFPRPCPTVLYLIQLFPEATVDDLTFLEQLKVGKGDLKLVSHYLKYKTLGAMSPLALAQFFAYPDTPLCSSIFAATLGSGANAFNEQIAHIQQDYAPAIARIQSTNPLVKAADLQLHGIAPGKNMGQLLKEAERLSVEEKINSTSDIIQRLKMSPLWPQEKS